MFYVERDSAGHLARVEALPFDGMTEILASDSQEVATWQASRSAESSLEKLKSSDLEMVRVLEDLIQTLISKGVIMITDLPPAAQTKLLNRRQARENLGGIHRLINDDERGFF
ncbi:tryptophan synthase subunit beta [Pseudomonas matsuisoli]|uniref:Tryptophan synthase subunit beta n=1 Tax=Pseudomonas matsuisoli TaxID=1515666 RepID=A0A917PZX7_9PSED|nr:tryptophan synthase subunit beta [Pseudomonas matsuisoli]GGK02881.1 hypothetical protein GCM10009304_30880 [Pseudomonas matsuisoli]